MATVSVRDLDDEVRDRLRVRAARNGRSMEAEIRAILTAAVNDDPGTGHDNPFTLLADVFRALGGVEIEIAPRHAYDRAVPFAE